MKKEIAEINEVLPNGNILINIDGHFTIEVIDSNRVYTAKFLADVIVKAINDATTCERCGARGFTKEGLCYGCYQLSDY